MCFVRELVQVAKAFGDPTRMRILAALRGGELCVCELCDALGITQSTLSTHLRVIRGSGLAAARKEGKWMYYALSPGYQNVVNALFGLFNESLRSDPTLARDAKRLRSRLSLRNNGSCCVGFENSGTVCRKGKK